MIKLGIYVVVLVEIDKNKVMVGEVNYKFVEVFFKVMWENNKFFDDCSLSIMWIIMNNRYWVLLFCYKIKNVYFVWVFFMCIC